MKSQVIAKIVMWAICLGLVTSSQAAIVGVSKLNIDSITIGVSSGFFPLVTDTTNYQPAFVWTMGAANGQVANGAIQTIIGAINYSIDSDGVPPSSGTVDTSLGIIDLDLSDLSVTLSGQATGTFNPWSANSTIDSQSYDSQTGMFSYGWHDSTAVLISGLGTQTLDYSILAVGTVTTVPVPPPVWLFGSGLLGLAGIARGKKAA